MIDASVMSSKVISIIEGMHEHLRPKFVPSAAVLERLIEEVFWASTDRYEGISLTARILFAPHLAHPTTIRLTTPTAFSRTTIRSVSPTHATDGALLVYGEDESDLHIHGILGSSEMVRGGMPHWLSVESRGPACVTIRISSTPIMEFTRGHVKYLSGRSIDRSTAKLLLMKAGLFLEGQPTLSLQIASMFLDIGREIDRHGGGGAIWILPAGSQITGDLEGLGWSVETHPGFWDPFEAIWEDRTGSIMLLNAPGGPPKEWLLKNSWLQEATQEWDFLRQEAAARTLAHLTKVDGAIVVNGSPCLLAFGVVCNRFAQPATHVLRAGDPSDLTKGERVDPSSFGGSRHRSAIDFCASHSPAGAIVASHDGGITVFSSNEPGVVIGSRVSPIASAPDRE